MLVGVCLCKQVWALALMCVHALLFVYTDLFGFVLSKYVNIPMYNVCVCICLHKPGRASMS